jgi:hypothetical protein
MLGVNKSLMVNHVLENCWCLRLKIVLGYLKGSLWCRGSMGIY